MDIFSFIDEELDFISNEGLKREFKTVISAPGPWVELEGNKRVLQFFNNKQYLVNIPAAIVAAKGWKNGDILEFIIDENGNIVIKKVKNEKLS